MQNREMASDDLKYFSKDYGQARSRFLDAASRFAERDSLAIVRTFNVPSRKDSELFTDSLFLPAKSRKQTLFLLVSGVHGVEAYLGSALQLMFLEEILPLVDRERTGVLMLHVMNPFGFKYCRRNTENNVNLNRNFAPADSLFQTENAGYERVAALVDAREPAGGPLESFLKAGGLIADCLLRRGFSGAELNQALAQGQYRHPKGLEFGGFKREPQVEHFTEIAREAMKGYEEIVLFDLHTGLGERYQLHVIPVDEPAARDAKLLAKFFDFEKDKDLFAYTPSDTAGFYKTYGDLNTLIPAMAEAGQRTLALTFEFGTLGNNLYTKIDVLGRLMAENRGFHHGYTSDAAKEKTEARILEQFYPGEDEWKKNAVRRTREVWKRVMARAKA